MSRSPSPAEFLDAVDLVPGHDWQGGRVEEGGDDHLVLVPGEDRPAAVVRFARRPEVAAVLPRRMSLLRAIAAHLPFEVPEPVTEVTPTRRTGTCAVGQRFGAGAQHPPGDGDPAALRNVVEALAAVPPTAWAGLVEAPYTDQPRWTPDERELVLQRLPAEARAHAEAVWDALAAIDGQAVGLVHGDLAGDNIRWDGERLVGVLDWDRAAAWDPAINLAQLALWHGPQIVDAAAPDARFAERARIWVGHLAMLRVHHAAQRQAAGATVRRWGRLLRKTVPRLQLAADAAGRL
jgi:aminoglycoside phosphotransferase (APT) family kinase protein